MIKIVHHIIKIIIKLYESAKETIMIKKEKKKMHFQSWAIELYESAKEIIMMIKVNNIDDQIAPSKLIA